MLSNMLVNKQLEVGKYISALGHSFLLSSFLPHLELLQTRPVTGSLSGGLAGEHATDGSRSQTLPKLGVSCLGTAPVPVSTGAWTGRPQGRSVGTFPWVDGVGDSGSERPQLRSPIALASAEAGGNTAAF